MPALLYILEKSLYVRVRVRVMPYVRLFSNSDCTMTHDRIIQFSFITAYDDIVPEEKVTFLATFRVWSEPVQMSHAATPICCPSGAGTHAAGSQ